MEGDANNRSDLYTSCTNNVSENTLENIHLCIRQLMVCDSSFLCFSADMHATLIGTSRIAMWQYVADVGPRQYQSFSHMVGHV